MSNHSITVDAVVMAEVRIEGQPYSHKSIITSFFLSLPIPSGSPLYAWLVKYPFSSSSLHLGRPLYVRLVKNSSHSSFFSFPLELTPFLYARQVKLYSYPSFSPFHPSAAHQFVHTVYFNTQNTVWKNQ